MLQTRRTFLRHFKDVLVLVVVVVARGDIIHVGRRLGHQRVDEFQILGHEGNALPVTGCEIASLEAVHQESLGRFLQGQDGGGLEPDVRIAEPFARPLDLPPERQLGNAEVDCLAKVLDLLKSLDS